VKYAELFAGAGGLSMGLEAAGFHCTAHAEIEPHARAVLRYRWPNTRLDGDVTKINGADYAGITLLSGGSPCQDLSVAGRRAGLTGSRSSLFHEQCRIWRESEAPYLLWENVHGAFSSNGGKDFATVLSTLVGATIPVPADGWRGGGVAAGRDAVAAWRVLDLQHFGPPQRRVRVFVLVARTGGVDPAEVLALAEGVCGHPSPRQISRERAAGGAAGGAGAGGVIPIGEATARQGKAHGSSAMIGTPGDPMFTLTSKQHAVSYAIGLDGEKNADVELIGTLNTGSKSGSGQQPAVLAFHHTQDPISGDVAPAIGRTTDGMGVLTFAERGCADGRSVEVRTDGVVNSLLTPNGGRSGTGCGDAVVAFNCKQDGTGRGTPIVTPTWPEVAMPLMARDAKGPRNCQDGGLQISAVHAGRPRRLTPKECERLMSWPDEWTRYGRKEDGTVYELSDKARYRLCGNGVASVVAEWIGTRLAEAIAQQNGHPTRAAT